MERGTEVKKIFELIDLEKNRQKYGLEMIPSENYVSKDVLQALGSILTNKYSEGYPGRRYYGGNEYIDEIEREAQRLANELFGTVHANVQPYSGSPANFEVDKACANPGDTILGMRLVDGGHLTHGASVSFTGQFFNAVQYGVGKDKRIDMDEVRRLAREHHPKVIWVGLTAYPYQLDFEEFAKIADTVQILSGGKPCYLAADIAHIAGLVIAGEHPSPTPFVDIITTTTHKTLRGPRGAMILVTQRGLDKDSDLSKKIDFAVFPGGQGGPHNHVTAAMAVAFAEAQTDEYKEYIRQVVKNAKVLAGELGTETENHLLLLDLQKYGYGMGYQAEAALEVAGVTVNKNTIPGESVSPFYPSGIRLGTPALTSRGMKEEEMRKIAGWIKRVLEEVRGHDLPTEQPERQGFIRDFKEKINSNEKLQIIREEIKEFAGGYPVPGID